MDRLLYATRARRAILDVLRADRRFLSVPQIVERLGGVEPPIATSTVYRTLDVLESVGSVARRLGERSSATYVYGGERHHHHAICRACGAVEEIECEPIERLRSLLMRERGFELDDHALEIYGFCSRCRARPR